MFVSHKKNKGYAKRKRLPYILTFTQCSHDDTVSFV